MNVYGLALELELKNAQEAYEKACTRAMDALDTLTASGASVPGADWDEQLKQVVAASDKVSEIRVRMNNYKKAAYVA